jgi:hypothetical protein
MKNPTSSLPDSYLQIIQMHLEHKDSPFMCRTAVYEGIKLSIEPYREVEDVAES